MLKEFKDFLFRGNIVELAVAFVMAHFGQKVTFAVSGTSYPWVVAKCYQNGVLVYEQANGIFETSLNQIFALGPTGYWTGGAADCTALLQNWSTSKHTTLATLNFHVYA